MPEPIQDENEQTMCDKTKILQLSAMTLIITLVMSLLIYLTVVSDRMDKKLNQETTLANTTRVSLMNTTTATLPNSTTILNIPNTTVTTILNTTNNSTNITVSRVTETAPLF